MKNKDSGYKLYNKLTTESKNLSTILKQNKTGEDIFTQRNLDMVSQFIRNQEKQTLAEKQQLKVVDFPTNNTWFNSEPISMERHLKGKIVLLDFWTYCCINCLHVMPDLEYLEKKF